MWAGTGTALPSSCGIGRLRSMMVGTMPMQRRYELQLDMYIARIEPTGDRWAIQVWDTAMEANVLPINSKDPSHIVDSLNAAKVWGCWRLGQIAPTAQAMKARNPCAQFGLEWEEVLA
jgi:hypothetical protein